MKITAASWLLIIGLMLGGSGLAYGETSVKVAASTSCGTAFQKSDSLDFTDQGEDVCAAARSDRAATTWALIVPGIIAFVIGAIASAFSTPKQTKAPAASRGTGDPGGE